MLHRFIFHNGRLLPMEDARLSPGQGGLLSGWGLFTTLRITQSVPFAFERHWKRLQKDSAKTHCPLPSDSEAVRVQLYELLRANDCREGSARIYVIYNHIGSWRSNESFPEVDLLMYTAACPIITSPPVSPFAKMFVMPLRRWPA